MAKTSYTKKDHAAFLKALAESDSARRVAALWLEARGWKVEPIQAIRYAPSAKDWREFADSGDVYAIKSDRRCRIEVKQLKAMFTSGDDWPFPNAIVDGKYGFDKSDPKPVFYLQFNRSRTHCAVIDVGSTFHLWTPAKKPDQRHPGREFEFYIAPVCALRFETIPEDILARLSKPQEAPKGPACPSGCDPRDWREDMADGCVRTSCSKCGRWIGNRPAG